MKTSAGRIQARFEFNKYLALMLKKKKIKGPDMVKHGQKPHLFRIRPAWGASGGVGDLLRTHPQPRRLEYSTGLDADLV